MILSASRRTDIPAFYAEWLFNRINDGYLYVKNPIYRKQISKILINSNVVDCIVFWTKNPLPMLGKLELLNPFVYYFQYTLNPYGSRIEKYVPNIDKSITNFISLSDKIGPEKVIWRYDPIFFTDEHDYSSHLRSFEMIARKLSRYTKKCVISFLDLYKKCEKNMKPIIYEIPTNNEMFKLASEFACISRAFGIEIETCAEEIDLTPIGVLKGKCIDDGLISKIAKRQMKIKKDNTQREVCGCVDSIDIGAYNTCKHNCLYCYANYDIATVLKNTNEHDDQSPLICGKLMGDEKVTDRRMISHFHAKGKGFQEELFSNDLR